MSQLKVLVGLPGAGKSRYARQLLHEHVPFDDTFTQNFFGIDKGFKGLIETLDKGKNCVVSDVNFCHAGNRTFFTRLMECFRPRVEITWQYFEPNAGNCRSNIEADFLEDGDEDRRKSRLAALDATEGSYQVPQDARAIPVVKRDAGPGSGG